VLGVAGVADAGVTLLSRQSSLRAAGGAVGGVGGSGVDDTADFNSFERFADSVGSEDAVNGIVASAQQYSMPGIMSPDGTGLQGAFGEGSVRASVVDGVGIASATSDLDLVFRVTDAPVEYTLGGAMGTTGVGSTMVQLLPMTAGASTPLYTASLDADLDEGVVGTGTIDHAGVLQPGDYLLRVQAGSSDTFDPLAESSAYYNFTFIVQGTTQPPAAVPLPPAALVGGLGMGLLGGLRAVRRFRGNREAA
jgi:hypothetical protein